MSGHGPTFDLPKNIERYLAALSRLYAQEGKKQLQTIVVNSQVRVIEEWSSDNWNGGTFGHALYLVIPETLYLSVVKNKDAILFYVVWAIICIILGALIIYSPYIAISLIVAIGLSLFTSKEPLKILIFLAK